MTARTVHPAEPIYDFREVTQADLPMLAAWLADVKNAAAIVMETSATRMNASLLLPVGRPGACRSDV